MEHNQKVSEVSQPKPDAFVRLSDFTRAWGLTRYAVVQMAANGDLPQLQRCGVRTQGWPLSEISDHLPAE